MGTKRLTQPASLGPTSAWQPSASLAVVVLHFGLFGCLSGVKGVIWADLIKALHLSEGLFGTAQLASPLMSTIVLTRYAVLAVRLGPKLLTIIGLSLAAVAMIMLTFITGIWGFLVSLALLGAGMSLLDGAMNQTAIDWERATRRSAMNFIHACFNGGAVLGSLLTGLGLGTGWSYGHVLVALAAIYVVSAIVTLAVRYPPPEEVAGVAEARSSHSIGRDPALRALLIICSLSVVVESIVFLWSVIYVRTELKAPVALGSAAFAVFNGAMFVGRMVNGPIVAFRGVRASLLLSGVGLIVGTIVLVMTHAVWLAIGALLVLGLAIAGIFPTVVAAAGALLPGKSGALTGALMTLAYLCFMVAPPVIGWVAQFSALRIALSLIGLCGVGIIWFAWRLDRLAPATRPPA